MKKILIIIYLLGVLPLCSFSQTPTWLDEAFRKKEYPSESYLTGFLKEIKVTETEKGMARLKELAKSDLIESLHVSIQSKSELKEVETKNKYNQSFVFESSSFSEADIYGLEILTHYDKKNKSLYVFAFVSKEKLIRYNKTIISARLKW